MSGSALDEHVFESSSHQELIPVLVQLTEKSLLERMLSASTPSNQILLHAQEVSRGRGLMNMHEAARQLHTLISFAEAPGGSGRPESAKQIFLEVTEELQGIAHSDLQRNVAARLAESTNATLGTAAAASMLRPELEPTLRRALIDRICLNFGAKKETSSAEEFLTTVASPVESMSGRLSFVRGFLQGGNRGNCTFQRIPID